MRTTKQHWLHAGLSRVTKWHFALGVLLLGQTVIYDAWKLIAPKAVLNRWIAVSIFLVIILFCWAVTKSSKIISTRSYLVLAYLIIVADIALASFNIYTQRGMSSRAVALYFIPIIVASILKSRVALFLTAALAAIAYTSTAIAYFVLNFNEGYKIELYGEVGFYSMTFFIVAGLLWGVTKPRR